MLVIATDEPMTVQHGIEILDVEVLEVRGSSLVGDILLVADLHFLNAEQRVPKTRYLANRKS